MTRYKPCIVALALGLVAHGQAAAQEDEYAAVRDKLEACFACHGESGASADQQIPIIAGQHLYYLYVQLKDFDAAGVNAPPVSYTVDGKQYIAVAAGGNVQLNYKRGNSIIAFTLAN